MQKRRRVLLAHRCQKHIDADSTLEGGTRHCDVPAAWRRPQKEEAALTEALLHLVGGHQPDGEAQVAAQDDGDQHVDLRGSGRAFASCHRTVAVSAHAHCRCLVNAGSGPIRQLTT